MSSGGTRRCGSPRRPAPAGDIGNGYVETDPTGRYGRFDDVLGKGAMKCVYRGFDEERGVEVAWNQASLRDVLRSPDAVQRVYSEVQLLSSLRHESLISFHASWVDASRRSFNFITELFSSGTLRSFRRRYPRVRPRAVRRWAAQVLRGLAYLHGHDPPVIHRDLKCDNLFINGHLGQVKIGDLGLAAVLRHAGEAAHSVVGTPEFMAPEMYDEEYDERVDVYAFGMCVLEMLTLELPYAECTNPAQIYKKVTAGKLPDAFYRVGDHDARRFIGRCLVAAAGRPSAAELLQDPFFLLLSSSSLPCSPPAPALPSSSADHHHPTTTSGHGMMTITGKLNAEEDTVFLKVQIVPPDDGDKDQTTEGGHVRNIYFPFDVAGDTATEVAREMVKELDITDRDPAEIADMIEQEIHRLLPPTPREQQQQQHEYCYSYYDDDDEKEGQPPSPFYYLSSSPASSLGLGAFSAAAAPPPHRSTTTTTTTSSWSSKDHYYCYPLSDDDDMSSMHSVNKYDCDSAHLPPPDGGGGEVKTHEDGPNRSSSRNSTSKAKASSSRGAEPPPSSSSMSPQHVHGGRPRRRNNNNGDVDSEVSTRNTMSRRNRSMVDMRSQLLHRTLVEELNRRLFFNTVGAVENIGFRAPTGYSASRGRRSSRTARDHA